MSSAAVVIGALRVKRPHMKIAEFVNWADQYEMAHLSHFIWIYTFNPLVFEFLI